jgi:hypothetical protein
VNSIAIVQFLQCPKRTLHARKIGLCGDFLGLRCKSSQRQVRTAHGRGPNDQLTTDYFGSWGVHNVPSFCEVAHWVKKYNTIIQPSSKGLRGTHRCATFSPDLDASRGRVRTSKFSPSSVITRARGRYGRSLTSLLIGSISAIRSSIGRASRIFELAPGRFQTMPIV